MITFLDIVYRIPGWTFMAVSLFAIIGAVLVALTREDAFTAGDRKGKWTWFGILLGSGLLMNTTLPFVTWVGAVITGVYWFDVRPQLKAIINGDYSY